MDELGSQIEAMVRKHLKYEGTQYIGRWVSYEEDGMYKLIEGIRELYKDLSRREREIQ